MQGLVLQPGAGLELLMHDRQGSGNELSLDIVHVIISGTVLS